MAIGLSAGPDQIADGSDPTRLVTVKSDGGLETNPYGIDVNAVDGPTRVDVGGGLFLADGEILFQLLVQLRVQNRLTLALNPQIIDTFEILCQDEAMALRTDQAF